MAENSRYFQWICGDRQGEVIYFDHIEEEDGIVYLCFKDNSRVNEEFVAQINQNDLTNKMIAEVENPNNIWKFTPEWVGREEERWEQDATGTPQLVVPYKPGRKVVHLTPPRKSTSHFGVIQHSFKQPDPTPVEAPKHSLQNDPVWILLDKSKKIDLSIDLNLTISVPSKELFSMLKDNFDDGENKTIQYIIEHMDLNEIKKSLMSSFRDLYNPQTSTEPTPDPTD